MQRWNLTSLPASTEKQTPRAPHPDAPRVSRRDRQIPRVLFSAPECRVIVVELEGGETMGDHQVRERALVHVVLGRVTIEASGEHVDCAAGTLVAFEPGEQHSVHAHEGALLLLVLAPWPSRRHYAETEAAEPQHLPPNASVRPLPARATTEDSLAP